MSRTQRTCSAGQAVAMFVIERSLGRTPRWRRAMLASVCDAIRRIGERDLKPHRLRFALGTSGAGASVPLRSTDRNSHERARFNLRLTLHRSLVGEKPSSGSHSR